MNFAIVISKFYVDRCLCLIDSLNRFKVKFYILCYDDESYEILKNIKKNLYLIKFNQITDFDKDLNNKIKNRDLINKIITSRPIFIKFLNYKYKIKKIFLLDSDIYFFSNPKKLIQLVKKASIAFTRHNFFRNSFILEKKYGKYNAGFLYFNLDYYGLKFLNLWLKLCKKWCLFEPKNNKFSDQKYLEYLIKKVKNILVIGHPGVNLAPWNLENKNICKNKNLLKVDNQDLIFFHFHGLRNVTKKFYILGIQNYNFRISKKVKKLLYDPYIKNLYKKNIFLGYKDFLYWKKNVNINLFEIKIISKFLLLIKKILSNDFYIYLK
jgi:hypothetical protein